MDFRETLYDELLPLVEKPSRYLGNELNTVHKNPADVDLRVCLFFPDLYELGLGNLGLHILYAMLNDLEWVWAERGYTPAPDMEAALRERGMPLFMYESKEPLRHADAIGFSLQSELTFTNVLNALDLGGIPLRAEARGDADPLIFAGGPAALNPEPMAPFLDFVVLGDGEETMLDIAHVLRPMRGAPRAEKLAALAAIRGVYVPELYPVETNAFGETVPRVDAPRISRRFVSDLDAARYPDRYIVPFTHLVHDNIALEVLRGCTHGCRFCHAGMTTRPIRERTPERILELSERVLAATGLEDLSLVSLSTCDYSRARYMIESVAGRAHAQNASVSLPSLRMDSFSVALADAISSVRRSGLTFAPEAATPRLRAVINKMVTEEELIRCAVEAFRRGWTGIKLYFMIGLPTETDEDVAAIPDLCADVLRAGRRVSSRVAVRTGVSTFVPKPHTPFQWARHIGLTETREKHALLAERFHAHRSIAFGRHMPETSFIEGLISRGNRHTANLIEAAWRRGARLESWDEHVHFGAWLDALEETGYSADTAFRARGLNERLPWDHIDTLVDPNWLREELTRATLLEEVRDCRAGKCNQCGMMRHAPDLCRISLEARAKAVATETAPEEVPEKTTPPQHAPQENAPAIQRIRLRIGRTGEARFLSHLEMQSAWIRALRRARIPVAYSQGFHAHARLSFATAAPLGEESEGDLLDVFLSGIMHPRDVFDQVGATLPRDFRLYEALDVPLRGESLTSLVCGYRYTLEARADFEATRARVAELLASPEIVVERRAKAKHLGKGKDHREMVPTDIRPLIHALEVDAGEEERVRVFFETHGEEGKLAKPKDIVGLLGWPVNASRVVKLETLLRA